MTNEHVIATEQDTSQDRQVTGSLVRLALWAALSLAFVAYLAFGSVSVRIWRLNNLLIERKSLRGVWERAYDALPAVEHQWLLSSAFFGSLVLFVVGVIVGARLLLDAPDDAPAPRV
jgi:hypothetical protein